MKTFAIGCNRVIIHAYFAVKSNIRLHVHIVTFPESYIDIPVETGDCQGLSESVFQWFVQKQWFLQKWTSDWPLWVSHWIIHLTDLFIRTKHIVCVARRDNC